MCSTSRLRRPDLVDAAAHLREHHHPRPVPRHHQRDAGELHRQATGFRWRSRRPSERGGHSSTGSCWRLRYDSFRQPFPLPLAELAAYLAHFERDRGDVAERSSTAHRDGGRGHASGLSAADTHHHAAQHRPRGPAPDLRHRSSQCRQRRRDRAGRRAGARSRHWADPRVTSARWRDQRRHGRRCRADQIWAPSAPRRACRTTSNDATGYRRIPGPTAPVGPAGSGAAVDGGRARPGADPVMRQ